jgi:hypothetical protein
MSCIWHDFAYWYRYDRSMRGYRNKTDKYNWLTRRYKRRNRHPRYSCKKHKDFCVLMNSFVYWDELNLPCSAISEDTVAKVKKKLQPFLLWLKRHYELVLLFKDPDYRSGFATYGYISDDPDDTDAQYIINQLWHISDRWQCSSRVRWIINLLEPEYEPFVRKDTTEYVQSVQNDTNTT